jgi:hypothetical protein
MHELKLLLNDQESILFKSDISFAEVDCCYPIEVFFIGSNRSYIVFDDFATWALEPLIELLKKALKKQLYLDASINENLGFMWNRELHGDEGLTYDGDFWIGDRYSLWSTRSCSADRVSTWLYNDDDTIVLEITPMYPFHITDPETAENFIPYEEFMNGYKSCLTRIIPQAVARQWLVQAEFVLQLIEDNIKYTRALYERENVQ